MVKEKVNEEIKTLQDAADEQVHKMKEKAKNLENEVIEVVKKAYPEATAFAETAVNTAVEIAGDVAQSVGDFVDAFGSNNQQPK